MNNKYKALIKDTVIFAFGKFGSRLILFFLVPLYTNVLTTEEYGTSDFIFTISQLLLSIFTLTIHDSVIRFGLSKKEKRENVLLCSILVLLTATAISLLCIPIFSQYDSIGKWSIYLSFMIITTAFTDVIMNYLKVLNKNILFSVISILQSALLAIFNIIFLIALNLGVKGYLLSAILSNAICVTIAFILGKLIKEIRNAKFDKALMRRMLAFSSPLIFNNISWWIVQSSDKLMIEAIIGAAQLGLYTAATKIPSLINVLISIFQQSWGISSIKEIESTNDRRFYSNIFAAYITAIFLACLLLNTIAEPFMSIYVGKDFIQSWKYVPLLVVSATFSAISAYFGSLYGALKKSMNNMLTTIIAAILNIIINLVLIEKIGIWGAVIGTVLSYISIAIIRMFDVNRFIKMPINYSLFFTNSILIISHSLLITNQRYSITSSIIAIVLFFLINRKITHKTLLKVTNKLKKDKQCKKKNLNI